MVDAASTLVCFFLGKIAERCGYEAAEEEVKRRYEALMEAAKRIHQEWMRAANLHHREAMQSQSATRLSLRQVLREQRLICEELLSRA